MTKDLVLSILKYENNYVSGEEISRQLGISRAAVNTAVKTLRTLGYDIRSSTNKGYLLAGCPDVLSSGEIASYLDGYKCPDGTPRVNALECYDTIDSTNKKLKELGDSGVPSGYAVVADEQTQGRGRRGKDFESPKGKGIYLSYLLRPECAPSDCTSITAWTAVAVQSAIKNVCGVEPGIKWVNDLVLGTKKICGILTELSVESESGLVSYIVIGIGINVNEDMEDFPPEIRDIAGSIRSESGKPCHRAELAAEIIKCLDKLSNDFPSCKAEYLEAYRKHCVTTGKRVRIVSPIVDKKAKALLVDDNFELVVKYITGKEETLSSGDVSVRGYYNYV